MRRANAITEQVSAPSKGLITRIPSNVTSPDRRAIVAGENVRAERGVLSNAPGYERVISSPLNLDTPANLIFQANMSSIPTPKLRLLRSSGPVRRCISSDAAPALLCAT
jgi:hypothetical protein